MLDELNAVKTKSSREKLDCALVKPVIWLKYKLGFGISDQLAIELHKPIRTKFKKRRVIVYNINDIWSADLMDEQKVAHSNRGYKYILTVIDIFTQFAYAIPLKSKSSTDLIKAFKKLFIHSKPKKL